MLQTNDELVFADPVNEVVDSQVGAAWKVIIADDDEMIHQVTKLALGDFTFEGKGLEFIQAFSGEQAVEMVREHPAAALILLDVVMESDDAGLLAARQIREEINNHHIRIILRTGQPGQAPEHEVISQYDINDYKEKTELTSQKLVTTMHSALRSFRDIMALDANKKGLEKVIEASSSIFELQSMEKFANGVLQQLTALLNLRSDAIFYHGTGLASKETEALKIIAGTGDYENASGAHVNDALGMPLLDAIRDAMAKKTNLQQGNDFIAYFESKEGSENVAFASGVEPLDEMAQGLVEIFCRNVSVAFDNIYLKKDVEETQREIVYRLSEAVETRSKETGNHVKRVAEYSKILARGLSMDEDEAEIIRLAAPLHDLGKIGIPDAILNKPGKLDAEEWEVMQTHAMLGHDMLQTSKRGILQAGAQIALGHHEKWDGSGYPNGRKGNDIHIYGRIVALADVFDALGSDRCYKKAWEYDKITSFLEAEKGKQFDPELISIFFDQEQEFLKVNALYKD